MAVTSTNTLKNIRVFVMKLHFLHVFFYEQHEDGMKPHFVIATQADWMKLN